MFVYRSGEYHLWGYKRFSTRSVPGRGCSRWPRTRLHLWYWFCNPSGWTDFCRHPCQHTGGKDHGCLLFLVCLSIKLKMVNQTGFLHTIVVRFTLSLCSINSSFCLYFFLNAIRCTCIFWGCLFQEMTKLIFDLCYLMPVVMQVLFPWSRFVWMWNSNLFICTSFIRMTFQSCRSSFWST